MIDKVRERFNKTKLVKQGGLCWECCDYEGIVENMKEFVTQALETVVEEERERIMKIAKTQIGYHCDEPNCDHNLKSFIGSMKELTKSKEDK